MKLVVRTLGDFGLVSQGVWVDNSRPYLVEATPFWNFQVARNMVEIIATVQDDNLTDEALMETWQASEGNLEVAVGAFISVPEAAAEPQQKQRGKKAES